MGKLSKDIDNYDTYGEQITALSVHLILANEYELSTLKESKVLLDYILGQTSKDMESGEAKRKQETGDPIKDNAAYMGQKIRKTFLLAQLEKCFQIRLDMGVWLTEDTITFF